MRFPARVGCRVFQAGMRVAIPFLPYRQPRRLSHPGEVAALLAAKRKERVLIVTDGVVRRLHLTDALERALAEAGITVTVYDQTPQNPTIDAVETAARLYRDNRCQSLISVGGGSCIDCAKLTGARIARPGKPFSKMEGILKVRRPLPLHIAVPTTAGTGSETTLAAVLTDDESRHKYPINDFFLIPPYTMLDPAMTASLPRHLTATTGMDAMTHAVEAYIGRSSTMSTRRFAVEAVRLINDNILRAYDNADDREARANMLRASYLAGLAFTKSYVGYVHGVAHSLGGQYHTPHGLANSVLLPIVLRWYGESARRRLAKLARRSGISADPDDARAAQRFIDRITELNDRMGVPRTLDVIDEADIPAMARKAARESNPLYPVPVLRDAAELQEIYHLAKTPATI